MSVLTPICPFAFLQVVLEVAVDVGLTVFEPEVCFAIELAVNVCHFRFLLSVFEVFSLQSVAHVHLVVVDTAHLARAIPVSPGLVALAVGHNAFHLLCAGASPESVETVLVVDFGLELTVVVPFLPFANAFARSKGTFRFFLAVFVVVGPFSVLNAILEVSF